MRIDEKELLRQLQEQRAGALETAIAQYGAYVLAVIRNRSRGVLTPEDHEEIASDVFLALWRGAKNITRGQLRPWLGAVARKQTAEAMRKKNVYLPLRTMRSSRSTASGSRWSKRSAAKRSRRRFRRCRRRTGRSFTGSMT
ncbi:MAG: sigma factor [Oscillospiraceae bacterium]